MVNLVRALMVMAMVLTTILTATAAAGMEIQLDRKFQIPIEDYGFNTHGYQINLENIMAEFSTPTMAIHPYIEDGQFYIKTIIDVENTTVDIGNIRVSRRRVFNCVNSALKADPTTVSTIIKITWPGLMEIVSTDVQLQHYTTRGPSWCWGGLGKRIVRCRVARELHRAKPLVEKAIEEQIKQFLPEYRTLFMEIKGHHPDYE